VQEAVFVEFAYLEDAPIGNGIEELRVAGRAPVGVAVEHGGKSGQRKRERGKAWAQAKHQAGQGHTYPQQGNNVGIEAGDTPNGFFFCYLLYHRTSNPLFSRCLLFHRGSEKATSHRYLASLLLHCDDCSMAFRTMQLWDFG